MTFQFILQLILIVAAIITTVLTICYFHKIYDQHVDEFKKIYNNEVVTSAEERCHIALRKMFPTFTNPEEGEEKETMSSDESPV